MKHIKSSWEKQKRADIPVEVLEHIAARGSFVVVKSKRLFRDFDELPKKTEITETAELSFAEQLNQKIREVNLRAWLENLADNMPAIKKHQDISRIPKGTGKTVIIVGAGPSFKQRGHMEILAEAKNRAIISTDRMFIPLLEAGITPDFVVSVDGHREFIIPFYESKLIDKNIATSGVMAVTIAPNVVERFPGNKFFFTPMIDDIEQPVSLTTAIGMMTRTSILSAGGNTGITAVYLAFYLGYTNIILTGLDLGYTPDIPIESWPYYRLVKEADPTITPEKYKELYVIEGYNPDFKVKYRTDITWKSHIDDLLLQSKNMSDRGVNIINATEGGGVHGNGIKCLPLKEALLQYE